MFNKNETAYVVNAGQFVEVRTTKGNHFYVSKAHITHFGKFNDLYLLYIGDGILSMTESSLMKLKDILEGKE